MKWKTASFSIIISRLYPSVPVLNSHKLALLKVLDIMTGYIYVIPPASSGSTPDFQRETPMRHQSPSDGFIWYRGTFRPLMPAISFCELLVRAPDHRWRLEWRLTGKAKALPSGSASFSPQQPPVQRLHYCWCCTTLPFVSCSILPSFVNKIPRQINSFI